MKRLTRYGGAAAPALLAMTASFVAISIYVLASSPNPRSPSTDGPVQSSGQSPDPQRADAGPLSSGPDTVDGRVEPAPSPTRREEFPLDLLIGPIAGLTTDWHPAPQHVALPSGTPVIRMRQMAPAGCSVTWTGAQETLRDGDSSTAECPLAGLRDGAIATRIVLPDGRERVRSCSFEVTEVAIQSISITPVQVSVPSVNLDENSTNEETMSYFFGSSIADLRDLGNARYSTSIDRLVRLDVDVTPRAFAPLIEWRHNGQADQLGVNGRMRFFSVGAHAISVGPPSRPQSVEIQTYAVSIVSHVTGESEIPEGEEVKFIAVTNPPGFEGDIHWISSTKYGTARPVVGHGPTFTVQFDDTFGDLPDGGRWQWLGVRADNAVVGQDQKCPPLSNHDPFSTDPTPGRESFVSFGAGELPPIPADFFGPGSEPFVGQVNLLGVPLSEECTGLTDTLVRRSGPVEFPGGVGSSANVDIQIVELSLTASDPIIVGGETWYMAMGLSNSAPQMEGSLMATLESPDGGTFSATVPVLPMVVFASETELEALDAGMITEDQVNVKVIDYGDDPGVPPVMMSYTNPAPFSVNPPMDGGFFVPGQNFYPGVTTGARANLPPHVPPGSPGAAHFTCPPPPPPPGLCTYRRVGCWRPFCFWRCPAPPVGKILRLCAPVGQGAPFCQPCPRWVVVVFRCQPIGFCVCFYRCIGCNPC